MAFTRRDLFAFDVVPEPCAAAEGLPQSGDNALPPLASGRSRG